MTILRLIMTDQDDLLENVDRIEDYLIKIWLEATRQADERSKTNE